MTEFAPETAWCPFCGKYHLEADVDRGVEDGHCPEDEALTTRLEAGPQEAPPKTEYGILDRLEQGPFSRPGFVLIRQVRNATGFNRKQTRYADGVAVSLFPSRGVFFAGIEVKVSRSDWQKELADVEKSAEIQRFCRHWWIAAPPGIVNKNELPPTWGLYEIGDRCRPVIQAPVLECEPPSVGFTAALLRANVDAVDAQIGRASDAAYAKYKKDFDPQKTWGLEEKVRKLEYELKRERESREHMSKRVGEWCEIRERFHKTTGVWITEGGSDAMTAEVFKLAQSIKGGELGRLAAQLDAAAKTVAAADAALKAKDEVPS